ncbi:MULTISPECIES: hypothetical protein [unclassified Acinetobacter]|uniref:hypothetical protein n=1 Tax=unclassified Acinetobacter TaxID=196816 RepID=UPI001D0E0405|nr:MULTISPECIES: hypothetical protein [unclassified Acinetobacter]
MFIIKNIFIFLLSIVFLCLLIIFLNYLGFIKILNLVVSAIIFGTFITLYFKELKLCLSLLSLFFGAMLCISQTMEVVLMFLVTLLVYFLITTMMPKLKNMQIKISQPIKME